MSFEDFKIALEKLGKNNFNPEFKIVQNDDEVLFRLYVYFTNNIEEAKRLNISLRKGILLSGPVGCGKTTILQLIKTMTNQEYQYIIKSCRDVSYEFMKDGFDVVLSHGRNSYYRNLKPKTYCFDDLGTENNMKFYGNESNVMAEILLSRYDQFIAKGMMTHMTTNLTSSEIEDFYGTRVRSRLREMFNLISFDTNAMDKRC
jgi:DNA replication protein DnaC